MSLIKYNTKFATEFMTMREIHVLRKSNINTTQMAWISKRMVADFTGEVFYPKALIILFLN